MARSKTTKSSEAEFGESYPDGGNGEIRIERNGNSRKNDELVQIEEPSIFSKAYSYFFGVDESGEPATCKADVSLTENITKLVNDIDLSVADKTPEYYGRFLTPINVVYVPFFTPARYVMKANQSGAHIVMWKKENYIGLRVETSYYIPNGEDISREIHLFKCETDKDGKCIKIIDTKEKTTLYEVLEEL
jgi:hypothetical protein